MAYEVVMPYHLHMPSYFLETFTEYPIEENSNGYNFSHLLDMYNFICSNILSFFICSKDTIFSCKNYRLLMIII